MTTALWYSPESFVLGVVFVLDQNQRERLRLDVAIAKESDHFFNDFIFWHKS